MMAAFDGLRRLRVPPPLAGLPVGLTGWRPPLVRPSPPPCGWSIGFMAVPRTCGRWPSQRLRPALPTTIASWSALPIAPIVARQADGMRRISPLGRLIWAQSASRAARVALDAGRATQPAAATGLQFDVVDRQCPAECSSAAGSCRPTGGASGPLDHLVARLQSVGSEDVTLLAVDVVQQRDAGAAVRIVLDRCRRGPARRPCCGESRSAGTSACDRRRDAGP